MKWLSTWLLGLACTSMTMAATPNFAESFDKTPPDGKSVAGLRGQAAVVGNTDSGKKASRSFDRANILKSKTGTVALWFKPLDWNSEYKKNIYFFNATTANGWIHLYKYEDIGMNSGWSNKIIFLYGNPERDAAGNYGFKMISTPTRWDFNSSEWCFLTASWSPDRMKLFVNGKPVAESTINQPCQGNFPWFEIGGATDPATSTAVDELKIFDRELNEAEVYAIFEAEREIRTSTVDTLSIGKVKQSPPTLDGQIGSEEYPASIGVMFEVSNQARLAARQSTAHLGYDDKNLYLALQTPGDKLQANGQNATICWDDTIELYVMPSGKRELSQWIINSANNVYTEHNQNSGWVAPNFRFINRIQDGVWTMEAVIPFADLGEKSPKAGDTWKINIARTFTMPKLLYTALGPSTGTYSAGMIPVRFEPESGNYQIGITGDIYSDPITPVAKPAGANIQIRDTNGAPSKNPENAGSVEFSVPGLYHAVAQFFPITLGNYQYQYMFTDIARRKLHVGSFQPTPLVNGQPTAGRLYLTDADGRCVKETRYAGSTCDYENILDLKDLVPADYQLHIELADHSGNMLWRFQTDYKIYPDGDSPWHGNPNGISTQVPPPWTPIEVDGNTVKVWGRSYHFSPNALFPVAINSQNQELLKTPINLVGRQQAQTVTGQGESLEIIRVDDTKCIVKTRGKIGILPIEVTATIEFDGFIWFEVAMQPESSPVRMEELSLQLVFNPEAALLRNFGDYKLQRTGAMPKSVFTKDLLNESPLFWIGGNDAGLQWLADDLRNYELRHPAQALTVTPGAAETIAKVNIFDTQVTVTTPRTISFGLEATPFRPVDLEARRIRMWRNTRLNFNELFTWYNYPDVTKLNPPMKRELDTLQAANFLIGPYMALGAASPLSPEYRYYGDNWRLTPAPEGWDRLLPDRVDLALTQYRQHYLVCPCDDFVDFYMSKFVDTFKALKLNGWYMDWGDPRPCDNALHGHGWIDWKGQRRCSWNFRNIRNFTRRMYTAMKEINPQSQYWVHSSGVPVAAAHGFCDFFVDGENIADKVGVQMNYYKIITLDTFRAGYNGRQWGWQDFLLPQFTRMADMYYPEQMNYYKSTAAQKVFNHVIGLVMVHDSQMHSIFGPDQWPIFEALKPFGWDENVIFHPYWKNADYVEKLAPADPDAVVSFFERADKYLLFPFNNTDRPVEFKLRLHPETWGKMHLSTLKDLQSDEELTPIGKEVVFTVSPRSFRMIMGSK